jgi:hypothetical protein
MTKTAREAYDNRYHKIRATIGFDEFERIWNEAQSVCADGGKGEAVAWKVGTIIHHNFDKASLDAIRWGVPVIPLYTVQRGNAEKEAALTDEQMNDIARKYFGAQQPTGTVTLYQCREFARAILAADKGKP